MPSLHQRVVEQLRARGVEDTTPFNEAIAAYVRAMEDVAALRKRWQSMGSPIIALGGSSGLAEVAHPLIGMIDQAEKRATDLRARLMLEPKSAQPARAPGRPAGAASAPDRAGDPGRIKLRAVK